MDEREREAKIRAACAAFADALVAAVITPVEKPPEKLLSVREVCAMLSISRSQLYHELDLKRLRSLHVGRRRLITSEALREYMDGCEFGFDVAFGIETMGAAGRKFPPLTQSQRHATLLRDGWLCGICGSPIDRNLGFPDPMSASIDHIDPAGAHDPANWQAAHLGCNSRKGGPKRPKRIVAEPVARRTAREAPVPSATR